jgi:hypothetical protein
MCMKTSLRLLYITGIKYFQYEFISVDSLLIFTTLVHVQLGRKIR